MALYFSLAVECGSDHGSAVAVAAHFERLPLRLGNGSELCCETHAHKDAEDNWWAYIYPPGMSATGRPESLPELRIAARLTEAGNQLYARLRDAPDYRYGMVGIEVDEFRYFSELEDDEVIRAGVPGMVIANRIWARLGSPRAFERFSATHQWVPYQGERQDL